MYSHVYSLGVCQYNLDKYYNLLECNPFLPRLNFLLVPIGLYSDLSIIGLDTIGMVGIGLEKNKHPIERKLKVDSRFSSLLISTPTPLLFLINVLIFT